jgi:hypothetical protein
MRDEGRGNDSKAVSRRMGEKKKMAITDKDIKKLSEVFATKGDLKGFATKDDLSSLRKDILDGQDKIMKELETARQDRNLALGKDREQDRRLDNLEGRMQTVEARV